MFVVIVVLCCILVAVWSWIRPQPPSPPIHPGALPLIGHAHLLLGNRKQLWKVFKKLFHFSLANGGVCQFKISVHTVYVLTDPDESLMVSNMCLSKPYLYDFIREFVYNGLAISEVPTWKTHRKLLNPSFNQQVLYTFMNEINVQARSLVSELAFEVGNKPFDVRRFLANFILRSVSRTSLGLAIDDQALIDKQYAETIEELTEVYMERAQKLWWHLPCFYNWSPLKRKEEKLAKKLNDIVNPAISKRKITFNEGKNGTRDNGRPQETFTPLLDQMFDIVDKHNAFTDDDIRDHMHNFMVASYDTTSSSLKYILLLLGSYPDVQERVFRELQEVFGDTDADCIKDDLPKLVYLEAVIKETLRLYPSVTVVGRKIHTDVKLKNYTLRAGSSCMLGLYGINRHPIWGTDAEQFRPERWLNPATLPDNPNAFAAFSLGRRNCIGLRYAMITMKTVLSHILRRYYVTSDITNLVSQFDVIMQAVEGDLINLTLRS